MKKSCIYAHQWWPRRIWLPVWPRRHSASQSGWFLPEQKQWGVSRSGVRPQHCFFASDGHFGAERVEQRVNGTKLKTQQEKIACQILDKLTSWQDGRRRIGRTFRETHKDHSLWNGFQRHEEILYSKNKNEKINLSLIAGSESEFWDTIDALSTRVETGWKINSCTWQLQSHSRQQDTQTGGATLWCPACSPQHPESGRSLILLSHEHLRPGVLGEIGVTYSSLDSGLY